MDNEKLILSEIKSLTTLVSEKHNHLDKRMDIFEKEIERNKNSIADLYGIQRKQEDEMAEMEKAHITCGAEVRREIGDVKNQPAIDLQKNMKGLVWKMITAIVTTVVLTTVLPKLLEALK